MCVNAIFEKKKKKIYSAVSFTHLREWRFIRTVSSSSSTYLSVMWIVFHCLQRSPAARGIWPQNISDSLHKLRFPTW